MGLITAVLLFATATLGATTNNLNNDVRSLNTQVGKLNQANDQRGAEITEANAILDERLDPTTELRRENRGLKDKLPAH